MYFFLIFIASLVFQNALSMMRADPDEQLKKTFAGVIAHRQRFLDMKSIPPHFDTKIYGDIIQWDPKQHIVGTHFGGLYQYQDAQHAWKCIRKGECANQAEFFNGVHAQPLSGAAPTSRTNIDFHVSCKAFPTYTYNSATNIVMYCKHEIEKYGRCYGVTTWGHNYNSSTQINPLIVVFEKDGKVIAEKKVFNSKKCIIRCAQSNHAAQAPHYALCASYVTPQQPDSDIWKKKYTIRFLKNDGNHITPLTYSWSEVESQLYDMHFANDHLTTFTVASDDQRTKRIISPTHGMSAYNCNLDCGRKLIPFGVLYNFDTSAYEKIYNEGPKVHCTDERMSLIPCLYQFLPSELVHKILYDFLYVDKKLQNNTYLLYGTHDTFCQQDKKAIVLLHDLRTYIVQRCNEKRGPYQNHNTNSNHYYWWQGIKNSLVQDSNMLETYDEDALWNATRYGILNQEKSMDHYQYAKASHIVLNYLFSTLSLPPFQTTKHPFLKAEVVADTSGKISINHAYFAHRQGFCKYVQNTFWREYVAQALEEKSSLWFNKEHAQQFVENKSFSKVLFNGNQCSILLKDKTTLPVACYLRSATDMDCKLLYTPRVTSGGYTAYWKSKYDSRTLEQIKQEIESIDDSRMLQSLTQQNNV